MPIYADKRTGKKVIQYQIGFRNVPDPKNPGKLIKRPKYKTEVVGKSARKARKILVKREAEWEQKKYSEEFVPEAPKPQYTFSELMAWRHTFNTNMRKVGVDQTVIMKLTGHKTPSMFNRYNMVDHEDATNAMKRLNLFLSEQKSFISSDDVQTGLF
jgi:hypothetical protein